MALQILRNIPLDSTTTITATSSTSTLTYADDSTNYYWTTSSSKLPTVRLTLKKFIDKLIKHPKAMILLYSEYMFNPKKFFEEVKGSLLSFQELRTDARDVINLMIEKARITGQVAYLEMLEDERKRIEKELILIKEGFPFYVSENDVLKFKKLANKGIKEDYIKNFCRPIPNEVFSELIRAKKLQVFDNYVVMHYDPKGVNAKLTKKEEEKKRDPILFGVFNGSKRLYYIGDWVDALCDLTLDSMLTKLTLDTNDRKLDVAKITISQKLLDDAK